MNAHIKHRFAGLLAAGALLLLGLPSAWAQIKVACVGDSITAGWGLANPGTQSYPTQLQTLLGSGYTVGNYGDSGRTLMKNTGYSYWDSWAYTSSTNSSPNIVVIMLGTNDTKLWNWSTTNLATDYHDLIAMYQGLPTHPTVYICLAPPVYTNTMGFDPAFIQNTLIPAIQTVAASNGVTLIDNNTPLLNHSELFTDGVHPTAQGAGVIAATVADIISLYSDDAMIYSDQFNNGWGDSWSWMPRSAATSPVHSGSNSMACAPSGQWQAWWLKAGTQVKTGVYGSVSFWLHGGTTGGQNISIKGELNGSSNGLPSVSVTAPANTWQQFTIPLSDLGIANKTNLSGFQIGNGISMNTFYIDDLRLVAAPAPAVVNVNIDATQAVSTVNGNLFGINQVGWDGGVDSPEMVSLVNSIGAPSLRWPGGSWGDGWTWGEDRGYGSQDVDFISLSHNAGTDAFIIVNYGSGTAEEAAAGVQLFNITNNLNFTHWEVGNEVGGSWEWDHDRPEIEPYDPPYKPHDPWTYAMRFKEYYTAMKAVDPTIKIGAVADAYETGTVNNYDHPVVNPRTGQTHYGWTPVMLHYLLGIDCIPDFLIHHKYGPKAGDTQNLLSSTSWADDAASLRQMLTDYLGAAGANVTLEVTECGTTEGGGKQTINLPSGLYFADNLGQIMQTEFQSRLWWDMHNGQGPVMESEPDVYGWRQYPNGQYISDGGIFYGTAPYPIGHVATMMPHFAADGDTVVQATSDHLLLSVYSVKRANGDLTLMVVNKSAASNLSASFDIDGYVPQGDATVYRYGIPQDEAARTGIGSPNVAQSTFTGVNNSFTATFAPFSVSVMVLSPADQPPLAPTGLVASPTGPGVSLTWNAAGGAATYTVKRSTTSGGSYTTLASGVTGTSYLDGTATGGTIYYYVVSATNTYGTSPDSAEANTEGGASARAIYAFEGNAQDSSGNGYHGTPSSLTYVAGKAGSQAAQFNGSGGSATIPPSVTNNFTVTMWVKTTDTAGSAGAQWWSGKGLVDGEIGGGGADWGTAIVNGKFVLGVGSTGGDTTVASSVNINDGTWHHLAATRNNTSGAMQVYVDGVLRGSGTGPTGSRTWPTILRIGGLQPGFNYFNGTLDEVRLYDRILTVTEIAASSGTPPAVPTGFTAIPGSGGIVLNWSASTMATSYHVKRSNTSGSGYTTIATVSGTTFTDTTVSGGTNYHYVVTAGNGSGQSANSAEIATRTDALVLHLKLDEAATDSSGFARHAALFNSPAFAAGRIDNALGFTGASSQHATLPAGLVSSLSDFTISAWVKPTTLDTWSRVFDFGSGTGTFMYLTTKNGENGRPRFAIKIGGSAEQQIDGASALTTGTWTHLAVTLFGTTGTFYVNGVTSGSNNSITFDPAGMGVTTQNYLGRSQWSDPYLNGALDDFRIYSRALSGSEVGILAAGQLATPQNVTATSGSAQITLTWSAVAGATDYTIQRSGSSGGTYTNLAAGISGTTHVNTGLADGATWYYTVAAHGLPGTGTASAPVSATTYTAVQNWRLTYFSTISNSGSAADSADPDGDGMTNAQEFTAGTNPTNAASVLKVSQMQVSGNDMLVSFPTVAGKTYQLERSDTLQGGSWTTVQNIIADIGGTVQVTDSGGAAQPRRFYRVVVK